MNFGLPEVRAKTCESRRTLGTQQTSPREIGLKVHQTLLQDTGRMVDDCQWTNQPRKGSMYRLLSNTAEWCARKKHQNLTATAAAAGALTLVLMTIRRSDGPRCRSSFQFYSRLSRRYSSNFRKKNFVREHREQAFHAGGPINY